MAKETKAKETKSTAEIIVENKVKESDVVDLLLKQVEKPKNCIKIKAINVYSNRYRINIWTTTNEDGLDKCKISKSYFTIVENNEIKILM